MTKAFLRLLIGVGVFVLMATGIAATAFYFQSELTKERKHAKELTQHADSLARDVTRLQTRLEKYVSTEKQAKDLETRREIETAVESTRGLRFRQPVQYHEIERKEIAGVLIKKIDDQYSDKEMKEMSFSMSAIGLLPENYDFKKAMVELLSEQVGAFFDQHAHQLFMFKGWSLDDRQDRIILAHELTHALQDQHFQLAKFPLEIKENDDLVMATSALIEGDATMLMSQYMVENLSIETLRDSMGKMMTQDMSKLGAAPAYLRETLVFPYLRGNEFCLALHQQGGWERINEAFRDPPRSTSQILHPEKYLRVPREDPIPVGIEATSVLGKMPVASNVMGELGVRLLIGEWLDAKTGERAGEGWRGDRYLVFDDNNGANVFWKSLWSSPKDAEEFRSVMLQYLRKRYQLPGTEPLPADAPFQLDANRSVRLIRAGNSVLVVDAVSPAWAEALLMLPGN